jgi:PAS domain S-box-containing protein
MSKKSFLPLLEEWMKKRRLPLMPVIWGITCLLIGALVLIGLQAYSSAEKEMARQFNGQQLILARQAARGIESALEEIRQTAALLASLPEIGNWAEGKPGEGREPALGKFFESFSGKIRLLFLFSGDGKRFLSHPPGGWEKTGARGGKEGGFPEGTLPPGVETVRFILPRDGGAGETAREVWALITIPVSREDRVVGTLGCLVDFNRVGERFLGSLRPGKTGGAWMINSDGRFVAHYETELVGRDAFSARRDRNPNFSYERLDRILREEMLPGRTGMNEYVAAWHREKQGAIQKLIAYAPVRAGEQIGSVAVVVPYSDVTEVVWGSFKNSLWLLAILAGTLLAGTYVGQKINQQRVLAEEKVQWSEAVVKSQTRLQALFDGAPDAIILVDADYRISTVNKTGLDWYGRPMEDFVGKKCHQVFQGLDRLCPNCPAEESFATGKPAFRERATLVVDKTKRYLQLFTFPLHDRNGKVVEVVEYVKDVTAEKKLQQQVIQSERLAVVGRMSANVAHEIKNPLGTIVLNAELLQEELDRFSGEDTAEAKSLLAVVKSELDRLIEVVEEYLQFARLPKLNLEEGSVNEVVSDLLAFLKEDAAGRGILVQEQLQEPLPQVQLDSRQLRQALLNIVKNSLEAMPDGGKLTLNTDAKDGAVEIRIADTGRGIPEENWDLVFTPFFSTKHGGTGLGLPITSHIVEEHRGTINLESFVDLGTVFTIRLPALPPTA